MNFICLIIFLTSAFLLAKAVDYCVPAMCPYQGTHIRCNNDGRFSKNCKGNYSLVPMDNELINQALDEHNTYREIGAAGKLKCFYSASRMPALKWDENLAENAEYNVKTCAFGHDKCRSTVDFPMAGQNIYSLRTRNLTVKPAPLIGEAVFLWFEEYLYANSSTLESNKVTVPQTGHFLLLMNDRCTHMGCAFLEMIEPGTTIWRTIIFTCNYASTNILNYPSYRAGKLAARCPENDTVYDALCSGKGINANDYTWYNKN